jgi:hypothetical protein
MRIASPQSWASYMRNNDIPPHKHQIVNTDSSPLSTTIALHTTIALSACHAKICTDFSTAVEKQPNMVSFLKFHMASRNVCPIIKDKRNDNFRSFDGILKGEKFFSERFSCLSFGLNCRLCLGLWRRGCVRIGDNLAALQRRSSFSSILLGYCFRLAGCGYR